VDLRQRFRFLPNCFGLVSVRYRQVRWRRSDGLSLVVLVFVVGVLIRECDTPSGDWRLDLGFPGRPEFPLLRRQYNDTRPQSQCATPDCEPTLCANVTYNERGCRASADITCGRPLVIHCIAQL